MNGLVAASFAFIALGLTVIGVQDATHLARNAYLATFTERVPIPIFLTSVIRPRIEIAAQVEDNPYIYERPIYVHVTNHSNVPIWKLKLNCRASYLMDDPGEPHERTYVLFNDDSIMPGETRIDKAEISSSAGLSRAGCTLEKAETPVSWWAGFPPELGPH